MGEGVDSKGLERVAPYQTTQERRLELGPAATTGVLCFYQLQAKYLKGFF